jgi:Tfp pilus assembly protein PilF
MAIAGLSITGCAASPAIRPPHDPIPGGEGSKPPPLPPEAQSKYDRALREMAQRDAAGSWSPEACDSTAKLFLEAADASGQAIPRYNAGLALLRCKKSAEAKGHLARALEIDKKLTGARVKLTLIAFEEQGDKGIDTAIEELRKATVEARFSDPAALTALAMLELRRGSPATDSEGNSDFERAKKNIQRALAIDDSYMPAYNQLALYYLALGKQRAPGAKGKRDNALELGALVCSQAIKKDPKFAPIHNTAGLISIELEHISAAAASFAQARALDPSLFEAHMNFAAVNMRFRGFENAEKAYRAALKLRPGDYDAHVGLALALRAQAEAPGDAKTIEASKELEAARRIDPDRPEAYYNEAVLTQEYGQEDAKDPDGQLKKASVLFAMFIEKAKVARGGPKEGYQEGVERAKGRIADINQILTFRRQTAEEQKRAEEAMKQRAAEEAVQQE